MLNTARIALAPSLLAATMVVLGFSGGGFYARTQALVVVAYAAVAAVAVAFIPTTLVRLRGLLLVALVSLSALAGWTLLSGSWSGAQGRAATEFTRVALYVLALLLFAVLARGARAVPDLLAAVAAAGLALCVAALMTRLAPDVFTFGVDQRSYGRLQYPLRYASSLGLIAAIGAIVSLAVAADRGRSTAMKVLGSAVAPVFITTLLLSYSRGPIAAGAVALVVFLAAGLSTATPGALLATVGPSAAVAYVAYHADRLSTDDFVTTRAVSQGHRTMLALGICVLLAAVIRAATLGLDRRLERVLHSRRRPRRRTGQLAAGAIALSLVAVALVVATQLPRLEHEYALFSQPGTSQPNTQAHLTEVQGGDRLQAWTVAIADFRGAPLIGQGAGTFVLGWSRHRPYPTSFNETHSLYLQMLGELGLVGFCLLMFALGLIVVGIGLSARGRERIGSAAALAVTVAWAVAVTVDWHWQMPVVTLSVFALGGAALARRGEAHAAARPSSRQGGRWLLVLAVAAAAVLPARVAIAEGHLDKALTAFRARDFDTAVPAAEAARTALGSLPAPLMLLGYCAAIRGDSAQAVRYEQEAVNRDPNNWTYRYALATVSAAGGIDPRPAARAALRLNPREPLTQMLVHLLPGGDPRGWQRQVASIALVLPSPFD